MTHGEERGGWGDGADAKNGAAHPLAFTFQNGERRRNSR